MAAEMYIQPSTEKVEIVNSPVFFFSVCFLCDYSRICKPNPTIIFLFECVYLKY